MKHKGEKLYILHPGDLRRYRSEKDFTWEKIRKVAVYPEEIAEELEEERRLKKETKQPGTEANEVLMEMSEEELKKMIDEYLTEDRIFEMAQKIANQRKAQRVVINLPAWLKEKLELKARSTGTSMNAVMRLALTEYLAKDE